MNRDAIIRMARESGIELYGLGRDRENFLCILERFATLVAAAEREKCAEVCETYETACINQDALNTAKIFTHCAATIRARGHA
jgi:hypothetical protein